LGEDESTDGEMLPTIGNSEEESLQIFSLSFLSAEAHDEDSVCCNETNL